jgi:glyoxylase-like metal-dependent hydrolase (beta-lactamase superfamily II)
MAQVFTSRYLQTNAVFFADHGLLVDSPYFPDELAALPAPDRLFATHAHFDHLLGRLAFPDAPLLAAASTVAQLQADPARPARELKEEDGRTYVKRARSLDVSGAETMEAIPADGHTGDGGALVVDDVLCCGDYLSDVEIPLLSWAGSLPGYLATLDRLEAVLADVRLVVPGHGSPTDAAGARERLRADREYLSTGRLPPGRDTPRQREIDAANRERHPLPATYT